MNTTGTAGFNLQQQQPNSNTYDFSNVKTKPPPTSYGGQSRKGVGTAMKSNTEIRPMTSNRAANYTKFDPLNMGGESMKNPIDLEKKLEQSPEENFKKAEKEINRLIDAAAIASSKGQFTEALEKAKEAVSKEKALKKQKELQNMADSINIDLTYNCLFNLAVQYQNNGLHQEALAKYNEIIKSKQFQQASRLRVNMGNIYFQQQKYTIAIKMYRMALDIIPTTSKDMRFKILKNIGHSFVKLGQFQEAINSYESIIKGSPDFQTCFNLLLCLYAMGDRSKMKECFVNMIGIEIPGNEEEEEDEFAKKESGNPDQLMEDIKEKRREGLKYIVDAAKLIASKIEDDEITGFDWIMETLKTSNYPEIESEIEICKAMSYLKKKNIEKAIECLKGFEKKDKTLMARAASNISFLYFLENDQKNAEKYAEIAINYDRYNAKALVNRGNCLYMKNEFLRAKEQYLEAIGVEADCIEALYNLAYVNKKLHMFNEALQALEKLQTIVSLPEAMFQIASINELIGNNKQALKWFQIILTKANSDPNILSRVGSLFAREEDENQALHYYSESYRFLPVNLDTISWLGIYYVKHDLYERACHFFERASQIQPKEVKWRLMVASCYRRMGALQKALKLYEEINNDHPENFECLRFLVQLCKEMGQDYEKYAVSLKKLERAQESAPDYNNDMYLANNQENGQEEEGNNRFEEDVNINVESKQPKKKIQQKVNQDEDEWAKGDLNEDEMLPAN